VPLPPDDAGPLDQRVRTVTQMLADLLAAGIAEHPQDWHMLQRMWLDEPAGRPAPLRPEAPDAPSGPRP